MNKFNYFVGNCSQCRQNKSLPYCRDSYFICSDCESAIQASLEQDEPVKCEGCKANFSWLFGKFDISGKFRCRNCLPGGLCHLCLQKPATQIAQNAEGLFFACLDCVKADSAD